MKILIVDDMVENLYMLESLLKGSGYEVVSAKNGVEALERLREDSIDMIISDILMPKMDGFQLCRECKKDDTLRKIPFIFYTATYTDHKDEEFALSLGAERFIIKAMEPELFLEIIKDVVKKHEKGIPTPSKITVEKEDAAYLMEHNERLINKLDQKLVELEEVNSVLRSIRGVNQLIIRENHHDSLLQKSCDILIETQGYDASWLGFLSDEKTFASVVGSGFGEYISSFSEHVMGGDHPPCIKNALVQKDIVVITDKARECGDCPLKSAYIGKEVAIIRVEHADRLFGLLAILFAPDVTASVEEKELLEELAGDIALGLHNMEMKEERKQAEEEKLKLEAQLRQAQKMEAIGTLAGGIAHDFNNILSVVLGYTELALDVSDKGSLLDRNLQEIYSAGKRARDLIQHILTFSRQTEHEEPSPVQMKLIVKEALKLLRASLPSSIEIRQDVQSVSIIMADPTQIHRVLMNLCTNAGHAMQKDGGILEVSLVNVEVDADFAARHLDMSPGPHLRLTVSDTGYGIEPAIMERIFDPYFTTKEKGEGTGMGLSVVMGIVKSHGGAITVYSEPGKGSTFNVFLPVIDDVVEAKREDEEPLPEGNERILFVDDEPALVDVGRQKLEKLGYEVVGTISSLEALGLFKSQPQGFDLVISDMTMPHMTGDILAKEIMKIRPDIPIILCTGYSERISKERVEELGIRAFAMKPLLMQELATTVRGVLDRGG